MPSTLIARLALLATALVLAILASSAYLRLSATHGDCPQQGACATAVGAQEVPSLARKVVRATHRLSASAVAVVVLLLAALGWLRREGMPETRWIALLLLVLSVFLALLGAVAGNSYAPAATLGNVLAGNAMAAGAWWLYVRNRGVRSTPKGASPRAGWAAAGLVLAVALIVLSATPVAARLSIGIALAHAMTATVFLLACVWLAARGAPARR
jgi:heme A synthase